MTINETKKKTERMNQKIAVASNMKNKLMNFLYDYYGYKRDENNDIIFDENREPIFDFDNVTAWYEEQAPIAKELAEEIEKAIVRWIEK